VIIYGCGRLSFNYDASLQVNLPNANTVQTAEGEYLPCAWLVVI
jgi:hypothetical protein